MTRSAETSDRRPRWTLEAYDEAISALSDKRSSLRALTNWPSNTGERTRDHAMSIALSVLRHERQLAEKRSERGASP